jgi:hypothetical protein
MKEAIATQILLGFLLGHYLVFIDGVSLKSEGGTWGGSLVSRTFNEGCAFFWSPKSSVLITNFIVNENNLEAETISLLMLTHPHSQALTPSPSSIR